MNIERIKSDSGNHLVIKILPEELVNIKSFGITTDNANEFKKSFKCTYGKDKVVYRAFICDSCNEIITDFMYYVPVMNRLYCKECIDEVMSRVPFYMTDADYEVVKYNYFIDMISDNKVLKKALDDAGMSKINDLYDYMYMHLHIGNFEDFDNSKFAKYVNERDADKSKFRIFRKELKVQWDDPESGKSSGIYTISDVLNSNEPIDGKYSEDSERILLISNGTTEYEVTANELTIIQNE